MGTFNKTNEQLYVVFWKTGVPEIIIYHTLTSVL